MTRKKASAIVLAALALVLLLAGVIADRLGASAEVTSTLTLLLTGLALLLAGTSNGTLQGAAFQIARGSGPGPSFATALGVCLGMAVVAVGQGGTPAPAVVLGLSAALLLHGIVAVPVLVRHSGQSLGDVLQVRFGSRLVALLGAASALGLLLCLVALLGSRSVAVFTGGAGVSPLTARLGLAAFLLSLVIPGGARSVVAGALVVGAVLAAGWLVPAGLSVAREGQDRIGTLLSLPDAVFSETALTVDGFGWGLAALGLLAILHLPRPEASVEAGRRHHAFLALALLALACVAVLALPALAEVNRPPPILRMAARLAPPLLMVLALAMLIHVTARTLVRDGLYRLTGRTGTESGRMALQRLVSAGLILMALGLGPALPQNLLDTALGRLFLLLAASVPWSLLLLACWQRVDWRAALCGLGSAALAGGAQIYGVVPPGAGFLAAALSCTLAGALAALLFPARSGLPSDVPALVEGAA